MAESTTAPKNKNRRSTAKSKKLETARTRLAAQLAAEREREQRVLRALEDFVSAGERIAAVDAACNAKVAELETKIARQRELAGEKTQTEHTRQAVAAFTMHDAGRKVEQVAELLDLSVRETRELIAAGRQATCPEKPPMVPVGRAPSPFAEAGRDDGQVGDRPHQIEASLGGAGRAS